MSTHAMLAVYLVLACVPAILFYLIFRAIDYMGDDEVIEQATEMNHPARGNRAAPAVTRQSGSEESTDTDTNERRCPNCGEINDEGYDYCRACLSQLS